MARGNNTDDTTTVASRSNTQVNANDFVVKARRIEVEPHENADALEMARVDDYFAVVKKGEFQSGDLVIYIPEASIVPEPIIKEMGLEGRLAGGSFGDDGKKRKDRVKAIRLRGRLSQGLVFAPQDIDLEEGKDYAEQLGIYKWKPPIPASMAGDVEACPKILSYTDIANIKRYPNVLKDGEEVTLTEKLHGTCTVTALIDGRLAVSSKGNAASGRSIKSDLTDDGREKNIYWRMSQQYQLQEALETIAARHGSPGEPVHIYGETLGVQDLMYGLNKGDLEYRAFDIRVGQNFLDYDDFKAACDELGIPTVPLLYRGPWSREVAEQTATGKETFTGKETHVREGVVAKPTTERSDPEVGRVIFKVISPDYLTRRGDATEFE